MDSLSQGDFSGIIWISWLKSHIIRVFSEVASDGAGEPVEVKEISTTDPQFFFGLSVATIILIGRAVDWAIKTWSDVENIRKVRAETRTLGIHTEPELRTLFDSKIDEKVNNAIKTEVERVLGPEGDEASRRIELRSHFEWALNSVFSRIEHGIRIEIRSLGPPPSDQAADPKAEKDAKAFAELEDLKPRLSYRRIEGQPILKLPPSEPPKP